jgi:hypothetical protein
MGIDPDLQVNQGPSIPGPSQWLASDPSPWSDSNHLSRYHSYGKKGRVVVSLLLLATFFRLVIDPFWRSSLSKRSEMDLNAARARGKSQ